MKHRSQSLLALGAILFFIGLLSGFVIPTMQNPRMGLAARLQAKASDAAHMGRCKQVGLPLE